MTTTIARCAVLVVACVLGASRDLVAALFEVDANPGRLPRSAIPLSYEVILVPNVQSLALTGKEKVRLEVRAETALIQLNSLNQKLDQVSFDSAQRP